jgi:hypothetical protein
MHMRRETVRRRSDKSVAVRVLVYVILGVKELLGKRNGDGDLSMACQKRTIGECE